VRPAVLILCSARPIDQPRGMLAASQARTAGIMPRQR
jgi:hypothetical protein